MVCTEVSGGLGNQMFRYACARKLLTSRGGQERMVINYRFVNKHGQDADLSSFHVYPHEKVVCKRVVLSYGSFIQKISFLADRFLRKVKLTKLANSRMMKRIEHRLGVFINIHTHEEIPATSTCRRVFFSGSFENPKYFEGIREELIKDFTIIPPQKGKY